MDTAHFFQQFASFLEAGADATRETGESLDGGAEMMFAQARLLIKGTDSLAAAAAVVVGTSVTERAEEADQGATGLFVVGCGIVAVGTGYTGSLVAVFFCAR
jgi:hypothetical protein